MADTHGCHDDLAVPDGDVLIHAGDLTSTGSLGELREVEHFFATLPHAHKIVIAGNHDWCFERQPEEARRILRSATYLQDETTSACGLQIFGSPWQPWFMSWAFNLERGAALADKWAAIPDDTDVVVTHGPPAGILDETFDGDHAGCADLFARITQVRPRLHVFGHIHEARGRLEKDGTTFVNASAGAGHNPPMVLDLTL
jgi:Icc-related predicted phosphoesterase